MNKRALFNFVTGGVSYEKGKIYAGEEVAHLDPSNFEDIEAAPTAQVASPVEAEENGEGKSATEEGADGEKKEGSDADDKGDGLDAHKTITQDDLDANPDYVALGLKVGDPIPSDSEEVLE